MPVARRLGLALALIGAGSCGKLQDPGDPAASASVVLTLSAHSAPADGVSRVGFVVTLVNDTPLGTEVTLTTDAGTLAGAAQATGGTLKFNATSVSTPFALVSSAATGVATISARTAASFTSDTVSLVPALPAELHLFASTSVAKANGTDVASLSVRLLRAAGQGTVSRGTLVRFQTFLGDTLRSDMSGVVAADTGGSATIALTTRQAGTYKVVATSADKRDSVMVPFVVP